MVLCNFWQSFLVFALNKITLPLYNEFLSLSLMENKGHSTVKINPNCVLFTS